MTRPQGEPGIVELGCRTYDVIRDRDDLYHWLSLDGTWHTPLRREGHDKLRSLFVPDDVPEWVVECPHERVCDSEIDCTRLLREEPRDD